MCDIKRSIDSEETAEKTMNRIREDLLNEIESAREKHPFMADDLFPEADVRNLRTSIDYLNLRQNADDVTALDLINKQLVQAHLGAETMHHNECRRQLIQAIAILARMVAVLDKESEKEGLLPW